MTFNVGVKEVEVDNNDNLGSYVVIGIIMIIILVLLLLFIKNIKRSPTATDHSSGVYKPDQPQQIQKLPQKIEKIKK